MHSRHAKTAVYGEHPYRVGLGGKASPGFLLRRECEDEATLPFLCTLSWPFCSAVVNKPKCEPHSAGEGRTR